MKTISNFFKIIAAALFVSALNFGQAFALDTSTTEGWIKQSSSKIATDSSIIFILFNVFDWVLGITGTVAVAFIVVGGFRYATSAGNESLAESAKETITKAIMGLVFVLLAYVIASTINAVLLGCVNGVSFGGSIGPCR